MNVIDVLEMLIIANTLTVVFGAGLIVAVVRQNQAAIAQLREESRMAIKQLRAELERHANRADERLENNERWQRQVESRVGALEGKART